MTWLFARFYVSVLIVLYVAWLVHATVLDRQSEAETSRVFLKAHGGGARLVASILNSRPADERRQALEAIKSGFDYPVDLVPIDRIPKQAQDRIAGRNDIASYELNRGRCVIAELTDGKHVVRLGPFPNHFMDSMEDSVRGWMRMAASELNAAAPDERQDVLATLQQRFEIPVEIAGRWEIPLWLNHWFNIGKEIVIYPERPRPNDTWFSATLLSNKVEVVRFGPFPSFNRTEHKAATTTLALVLLPVALAIALMLRPVALQLQQVEFAARKIAKGDLSARVNEKRSRSTQPLAQAFNNMASRTETLVRTQRELLQTVSHELRTPLSRMKFAIELIGTATTSKERVERLEALDAATEEIDELVGELLNYVRMETTNPQLNREQIELPEMIEGQISKQSTLHPTIQFTVECDQQKDRVFVADRSGLQRVLSNLLSNGGRFAKSHVAVSTKTKGKTVIIDVDDDGPGIPESMRDSVFEPFVRLKDASNGHGVGLGLTLVHRIVTRHGGHITISASPLGGCKVRTSWPTLE